jgi:hypothetical protein
VGIYCTGKENVWAKMYLLRQISVILGGKIKSERIKTCDVK